MKDKFDQLKELIHSRERTFTWEGITFSARTTDRNGFTNSWRCQSKNTTFIIKYEAMTSNYVFSTYCDYLDYLTASHVDLYEAYSSFMKKFQLAIEDYRKKQLEVIARHEASLTFFSFNDHFLE